MVYGLATVRLRRFAFLLVIAASGASCGNSYGQIHDLSLAWRGVDNWPRPSGSVARSFAAAPFALAVRDSRPDPSAVGTYEDSGFVVRTTDNVAQYCSMRLGDMLVRAGARLNEPPTVLVQAELLDYNVVEGGAFHGVVRLRAIVQGSGGRSWAKVFVGNSSRWGRTHNPENFNEALSNALADVASQLLQDEEFASALVGDLAAPPSASRSLSPPASRPRSPGG